ncbi:MAG: efflux RND transporter periplasmic adaptor subunit [Planctomycetales bacterium]|nr:efflux RND transporter periplasmic adaptor subunit [Planctomycetales bacterium]
MNRLLATVAAVLVGAGIVAALAYNGLLPGLVRKSQTGGGAPAATISNGGAHDGGSSGGSTTLSTVVALAKLQPAGGVLELGGIPGDKIERLLVRPGQEVKKGDLLLTFESRRLRQLELEAADTQLAEAADRLKAEQQFADAQINEAELAAELLALDDMEIAAQETRLKSLEEQSATAQRALERTSKLSGELTSPQQLDQLKLQSDQARNEFIAAQELIKKLKAGKELKRKDAAAKLAQATAGRARVDAAVPTESLKKARAAAAEKLTLASLVAPYDGIILETPADEGDTVAQAPLIRMADVRRMVAVAEVYETQIPTLRAGQRCELSADALPRKLSGSVERVGTTVGKNRLLSLDPTQPTDAHVVEVRIALDEASSAAASKFVGLQTTATIRTAGAAATP